ncbi:hypothetical protein N339_01558, partial [Pterocles gutturalis]
RPAPPQPLLVEGVVMGFADVVQDTAGKDKGGQQLEAAVVTLQEDLPACLQAQEGVLDHAVCPLQAVVELQLPPGELLVLLVGLEDPVLQGVGRIAQQHVLLRLPHEVFGRVGAQPALLGQHPEAGGLKDRAVLHAAREGGGDVPELAQPIHSGLREDGVPALAVAVVGAEAQGRVDGNVKAVQGADAVREAPAGAEDACHVLQLLLVGHPEVEGLEQQDDGVAHLPDARLHCGGPHTEERAESLVLHVGGQVPQGHGHPLLQGQGGVEVGAVRSQPRPQLVADVEEGLLGHPKLLQPVPGPKLLQDHPFPPVRVPDAGPGTGVEVAAGSPPASDEE